jgi:hypothetical protein
LHRRTAHRFFPAAPLPEIDLREAVAEAALILRNSVEGMALRSPLILPVTAGYDSRVLLAASRNVSDRVEYYIDRMGRLEDDHTDVAVPKDLASALGLQFSVLNSMEKVPSWFARLNRVNVTLARNLPKTRMIYARFKDGVTTTNINGNASEICRNFFDKDLVIDQDRLAATELSRILFGEATDYATREIDLWQQELGKISALGYKLLDMLYWEQRMGNWGAHFPAEQDVAIEEFSPFNNRRLITLLLACPIALRAAPDFELYRLIIGSLWLELLDFPFNPKYARKMSTRERVWSLLRLRMN